MADRVTPEQRSANMRRIKSKNTAPEMIVRRTVWGLGYRYRLHRRDLPGCPDIVLPSRKKLILVHGCYWHGHGCKRGGTGAKSNQSYWTPKIAKNRERDRANAVKLRRAGWKMLTIWECETAETATLLRRISRFLSDKRAP